ERYNHLQWVCVPASLLQDKTKDLSRNAADWIGTIGGFKETTLWIDCMLLLIFGGIPWQARATLSVILAIDMTLSVIISAIIAVFYTFTGGLYAVAYTDVVQLFCIFVGLWVCVPASLLQDKTKDLSRNAADWIGTIGGFKETTLWIDCMLLLIFGGIPWQASFLFTLCF
ncbi:hypothetical protein WUBG_16962, partial [Wuchereria bancrofti]